MLSVNFRSLPIEGFSNILLANGHLARKPENEWLTALTMHLNEISSSLGNEGSLFLRLIAFQPGFHECSI
jgi:hypothetical protein